ncbi:MAG TPA: hypothetical protein VFX33_04110 [Actinomycetales bacterium]|jgi:hypothetical protein|nr:hypothetical protein [Actinomycetales bacterium]
MVPQQLGLSAMVRVAVRRLMANLFRDLAIVGAAFYGSADILTAVRHGSAGPTDEVPSSEALAQEVAEGIADIESFLAALAPDPNPRRPGGRITGHSQTSDSPPGPW